MVKLVITSIMEAETGDSEEILEEALHIPLMSKSCVFCPPIITSCWGMIVACSMLINVKSLAAEESAF
ncbi:unnamed protein product [Lathyrus oleraceus]